MLPPLGDLHRIECLAVTSRPPFEKWILRHDLLYERSALLYLCHGGIKETGAPARTCTSNLRLRRAACRALTLRELNRIESKTLRHAGAAPALCLWKRLVLLLHQ